MERVQALLAEVMAEVNIQTENKCWFATVCLSSTDEDWQIDALIGVLRDKGYLVRPDAHDHRWIYVEWGIPIDVLTEGI